MLKRLSGLTHLGAPRRAIQQIGRKFAPSFHFSYHTFAATEITPTA